MKKDDNFRDPITGEELERELAGIRITVRRKELILGLVTAAMLAVGVAFYVSGEEAGTSWDSSSYSYQFSEQGGYGYGSNAYAGSVSGGAGSSGPGSAGGCGSGGGGCGSGAGGAAADVSMADLERQALVQYKEETGKSDVTARVGDYGCHIQADLFDADGKIVRSYGFQGGPLYVIN